MKTLTTFIIILFCSILFLGCGKGVDTPEAKIDMTARLLTGGGNRYWHLSEVYLNNVKQVLTDFQKTYTKTFTVNPAKTTTGTFTDSDGISGTWVLSNDGTVLAVTFVTGGGVGLKFPYDVIEISETRLVIEYILNGKIAREVYYAY